MEDVIHAVHSIPHAGNIAHVADEEFDLLRYLGHFCLKFMTHIVLLFLVTGKNADLSDIRTQKTVQHRISE